MNSIKASLALTGVLLLWANQGAAKDVYVSQSGASSPNGSSGAPYSLSWLNTAGNWGGGSSTILPGDVVHLMGTFTGNPGPTLSINGSGTAGNPIRILFEPNAAWTAPTFSGTIISVNGNNYITIDGGVNGVISATDNGTSTAGMDYGNSIVAILGSSSHDLTVQNLSILNLTVRRSQDTAWFGYAFYGSALGNNITFSNCLVSWCETAFYLVGSGACTGINYVNNTTTNCLRALRLIKDNSSPAGYINNVTVAHNKILGDYSYWDPTGAQQPTEGHGECIQISALNNVANYINHVYVYDNFCTGPYSDSMTGTFYFEEDSGGNVTDIRCYNNLVLLAPNLAIYHKGANGNNLFANNTITCDGTSDNYAFGCRYGPPGDRYFNNIVINSWSFLMSYENLTGSGSGGETPVIDYNDMYETGNAYGQNTHGSTANPNLNANYQPTAASTVVINQGTNLSSIFTGDLTGATRAGWDLGAYAYSTTGASTNPVIYVTPNILTFGSILTNTIATNSITVQNTGGGTLTGIAWVSPPFAIVSGATYSLGAGQSQTVLVTYAPGSSVNTSTQTVTFTGAAGAAVSVSGSGMVPTIMPGLSFSSCAGTITAPMVTNSGGYIYTTASESGVGSAGIALGGSATYYFQITNAGQYVIDASVLAPNSYTKSFWVNIDSMPTDPNDIWDAYPYSTNFQTLPISWRGSSTDVTADQYNPAVFSLTAGIHELIIVGRESGVELGNLWIVPYTGSKPAPPAAPTNLRVVSGS